MHAAIVTLLGRTRQTAIAKIWIDKIWIETMVGIKKQFSDLSLQISVAGWSGFLQQFEYSFRSLAKFAGLGEQANHQVSVAGKIIEVSGMDQHRSLAEQFNREILIGSGHGHTQHGVPAPLNLQTLRRLLPRQLTIELGEIQPHAVE